MENHCTRLWVLLTFFNQLIKQISELNRFGQLSISKWGINIISRTTIEWIDLLVSKGELALQIPKPMLMNILALSQWKRAVTGKWKKLAGPQDICKGFTEIGNINCTIEPIHSRTARYYIHRPFWICMNAKRDPKKLESIRFQHKYDLWHRLFNKGLQAWCNIYASKQKSWTIRMENLQEKVLQYLQRKKS
jgi:hypothetical protein